VTSWRGEEVRRSAPSVVGRALVVLAVMLAAATLALDARAETYALAFGTQNVGSPTALDVDFAEPFSTVAAGWLDIRATGTAVATTVAGDVQITLYARTLCGLLLMMLLTVFKV